MYASDLRTIYRYQQVRQFGKNRFQNAEWVKIHPSHPLPFVWYRRAKLYPDYRKWRCANRKATYDPQA